MKIFCSRFLWGRLSTTMPLASAFMILRVPMNESSLPAEDAAAVAMLVSLQRHGKRLVNLSRDVLAKSAIFASS